MGIREDIRTAFEKDPAARSVMEVICCYPGLHALWAYRVAHALWTHNLRFAARLISHIARALTGIEIHPGAFIGRRVFIDHGSGVVIGETAEIGDDVLIYMGVVLGGTSLESGKRHPTIGSGAVIGSGAIVLGPIEVGRDARIGAGAVVVRPVPGGATVVGVPARIAGPRSRTDELREDPVLRVVSCLLDRQARLEERLRQLEGPPPLPPAERPPEQVRKEEVVREALRDVIDPEAGIDIVDLGLVREIVVEDDRATVSMVLTIASCPLSDYLEDQVRRRVAGVDGIREVDVRILDEPWDWDRFVRKNDLLRNI